MEKGYIYKREKVMVNPIIGLIYPDTYQESLATKWS